MMSYLSLIIALKGGSGSGNFGHAGRPGKVGGSDSSGQLLHGLPTEIYYGKEAVQTSDIFAQTPLAFIVGRKNKDLNKYTTESIPLNQVVPVQERVFVDGLIKYAKSMPDELPEVFKVVNGEPRMEGKYYVLAGHTRMGAHILNGDDTVRAKVYNFDLESGQWVKP